MGKIYAIGESTIDLIIKDDIPREFKPGGAVLNACVSLGRLKTDVHIITMTGNDRLGKMLKVFLTENNVNTLYMNEFIGNTRLALAYLDKNNNADYSFYQDPAHIFDVKIPEFNYGDILLHGSSFSFKEENHELLKNLIYACKNKNVLIYYDPNYRKSYNKRRLEILPRIFYNFENAHIIKGSDEDFLSILGTDNLENTFKEIQKTGEKILIYTMGAGGAYLKSQKAELFVPSKKIDPVSTIGAGDTFNAGIIYGLATSSVVPEDLAEIKEKEWKVILQRAVDFAVEVCLSMNNYISVKGG